MARSVNSVTLLGHLGAEPEMGNIGGQSPVCNLRLATTESWKDRDTQERREHTEWHRLALFGRLAEIAAQYAHKGSRVYVEGTLRTKKWQDKEGKDRYTTQINVTEFILLDSRRDGAGEAGSPPAGDGGGREPTDEFADEGNPPF